MTQKDLLIQHLKKTQIINEIEEKTPEEVICYNCEHRFTKRDYTIDGNNSVVICPNCNELNATN